MSTNLRKDIVEKLYVAALTAMGEESLKYDASANEAYSVIVSMLLGCVEVAMKSGANVKALRESIELLWKALPPADSKDIQ